MREVGICSGEIVYTRFENERANSRRPSIARNAHFLKDI